MAGHPLKPTTDTNALVSHYLTNKLIRRKIIPRQISLFHFSAYKVLGTVSSCYPFPKGRYLRVTHPSATQSLKSKLLKASFNLHVLSIPPAFILSQNQTLRNSFWLTQTNLKLNLFAFCFGIFNEIKYKQLPLFCQTRSTFI